MTTSVQRGRELDEGHRRATMTRRIRPHEEQIHGLHRTRAETLGTSGGSGEFGPSRFFLTEAGGTASADGLELQRFSSREYLLGTTLPRRTQLSSRSRSHGRIMHSGPNAKSLSSVACQLLSSAAVSSKCWIASPCRHSNLITLVEDKPKNFSAVINQISGYLVSGLFVHFAGGQLNELASRTRQAGLLTRRKSCSTRKSASIFASSVAADNNPWHNAILSIQARPINPV